MKNVKWSKKTIRLVELKWRRLNDFMAPFNGRFWICWWGKAPRETTKTTNNQTTTGWNKSEKISDWTEDGRRSTPKSNRQFTFVSFGRIFFPFLFLFVSFSAIRLPSTSSSCAHLWRCCLSLLCTQHSLHDQFDVLFSWNASWHFARCWFFFVAAAVVVVVCWAGRCLRFALLLRFIRRISLHLNGANMTHIRYTHTHTERAEHSVNWLDLAAQCRANATGNKTTTTKTHRMKIQSIVDNDCVALESPAMSSDKWTQRFSLFSSKSNWKLRN